MHASLYCLVLFICSVFFSISRSVDFRRGTDMRKGRRKGIKGERREDRGRKYARHMNFQKFLTTKPLTRNHPLLLKNTLKLTHSKVKTKKMFRGYYPGPPLQERGGEKEEGESDWKERVWRHCGPHFFIQVYAYIKVIMSSTMATVVTVHFQTIRSSLTTLDSHIDSQSLTRCAARCSHGC